MDFANILAEYESLTNGSKQNLEMVRIYMLIYRSSTSINSTILSISMGSYLTSIPKRRLSNSSSNKLKSIPKPPSQRTSWSSIGLTMTTWRRVLSY
jgi:hypothetical protein